MNPDTRPSPAHAHTHIGARACRRLAREQVILAAAHITGGGIPENLPRVLPPQLGARIEAAALPKLPVLDWLQEAGRLEQSELQHVFNCGVGAVLVCPSEENARHLPESAVRIGTLIANESTHKRRTQAPGKICMNSSRCRLPFCLRAGSNMHRHRARCPRPALSG